MLNADDYFARKRDELNFARYDLLQQVQTKLDDWYPGKARAKRLDQGVLYLVTVSASVANELRLRQTELLSVVDVGEVRLAISIGSID